MELTYYNITLPQFVEKVCDGTIDPDIWEQFTVKTMSKPQQRIYRVVQEINRNEIVSERLNSIIDVLEMHSALPQDEQEGGREETLRNHLKKYIPVRQADTFNILRARVKSTIGRVLSEKRRELANISSGGGQQVEINQEYFSNLIVSVKVGLSLDFNRDTCLLCDFVGYYNLLQQRNEHLENERRNLSKRKI